MSLFLPTHNPNPFPCFPHESYVKIGPIRKKITHAKKRTKNRDNRGRTYNRGRKKKRKEKEQVKILPPQCKKGAPTLRGIKTMGGTEEERRRRRRKTNKERERDE